MKTALVEQAKAEAMARWGAVDPQPLTAAIEDGLQPGDVIWVGGHLYAHIVEGEMVSWREHTETIGETEATVTEEETARVPISSLSPEEQDRLLVLKGVAAGKVPGSTIGRP